MAECDTEIAVSVSVTFFLTCCLTGICAGVFFCCRETLDLLSYQK